VSMQVLRRGVCLVPRSGKTLRSDGKARKGAGTLFQSLIEGRQDYALIRTPAAASRYWVLIKLIITALATALCIFNPSPPWLRWPWPQTWDRRT
jgi:hypothetical protein